MLPSEVITVAVDLSTFGQNSAVNNSVVTQQSITSVAVLLGPKGNDGVSGAGMPTGGTTNQVPYKLSNADYATGWKTLAPSDVQLGNVTNDTQLKASQLSTDTALAANSDANVPSQKAVKSYVDAEKTRAQTAESTNAAAISAETTRAQNAEATKASKALAVAAALALS